ncbi:protein kinase domain-containing protein [Kaistia nematophila]|uniref:Protein kinase n=1 Tax=Kaistia nematophila TaxID=2994654 RepID=A0A9X3ILN0_9HYPH|nr:protein kinase [Kaistia nematophila]MCX5570693.1 protein kinase [Kaistia nematophila]
MENLPEELQAAIIELQRDHEGFEFHPVGANGYLVFAKNRISGADVAVKFYYGAPGERRHDEPRLLASIRSPNVLRIIDARNLSDEWAFFLTPRCADGDLDLLISASPSAVQAIDVALGICTGASAIHANGLIHRDLKPANIVCDEGIPLIADFGSVRQLIEGETDLPASGHSALYRPPESFETRRYAASGDIYQIGLVTYQLLGGTLPYSPFEYFKTSDHREYSKIVDDFDKSQFEDGVIHRRAASGTLMKFNSLPPWVGVGAKNALRDMTHFNIDKRLRSMADVAAVLTRIRADIADWRWVGDIARLERNDRVIELRPIGDGIFEPMQAKGGSFRRIPAQANGLLKDLVSQVS